MKDRQMFTILFYYYYQVVDKGAYNTEQLHTGKAVSLPTCYTVICLKGSGKLFFEGIKGRNPFYVDIQ